MVAYIITGLIAYLIGSVNFSILISKKMAGFDVREKGSGNAGTTNILRAVGKKAAIITLLTDVLKGIVVIFIAWIISKIAKQSVAAYLLQVAALCVVIGHTYPIFFEFKGGKGIATSLGVLLLLNWKMGLICLIFALCIIIITRMVSLGSISAAVLFPILTIFIKDSYLVSGNYIVFGIIMAALIIFNHMANVKRIINGNENKLSFKKSEENVEEKNEK